MYSLDINFLNDRTVRPTEAAQSRVVQDSPRPLYVGVAVAAFIPAAVLGLWFLLQNQNRQLEARQAQLDSQLAELQNAQQQVESINQQVSAIQQQNQALATVFDRIKPWSAILQDVRDRVPVGVQIDGITQQAGVAPGTAPGAAPPPPPAAPAPGTPPPVAPEPPPSLVEITGQARNFNDVNDFLLTLQRSPFLKGETARLVSAELVDNPTRIEFADTENRGEVNVQLPQVVRFTIQSNLTDLPASQLMQELERTLAVGLASRIQALRDRGVLQQ